MYDVVLLTLGSERDAPGGGCGSDGACCGDGRAANTDGRAANTDGRASGRQRHPARPLRDPRCRCALRGRADRAGPRVQTVTARSPGRSTGWPGGRAAGPTASPADLSKIRLVVAGHRPAARRRAPARPGRPPPIRFR